MDYKNPDYITIVRQRLAALDRLRANPKAIPGIKVYYRDHIPQFITDWGITVDPRALALGRPAVMPFVLFPKQIEWLEWTIQNWRDGVPGITEKSRDVGISWLATTLAASLCLFYDNMAVGFGSSKEENVDKSGDPKCLLYKARMFLQYVPREFRGGWNVNKHAPHMRISIPDTGGVISGEAGDNIGRGGRTAIYFVDEAAHLERPQKIDASLSSNTDCRQDMSSVNGSANSFAIRRHSGNIRVFTFHWRDDPRKDDEWYKKKSDELVDPVIVAQEIDINYSASVEGIVIPAAWVQAAVDAHIKLKIKPSGIKRAALDIADQGIDKNAMAIRHGVLLEHAESWKGSADMDIYKTVEKAFMLCDIHSLDGFDYDADGIGAAARGDARKVNEAREEKRIRQLQVHPFRGSGAVLYPEKEMIPGRKNIDFFENFKAQAWWSLRYRFLATYRAVVEGHDFREDEVISISSQFNERARLCVELSQPTYGQSKHGKMLVEKQPDGTASPNLADAVMMLYAPRQATMLFSTATLEEAASAAHRLRPVVPINPRL